MAKELEYKYLVLDHSFTEMAECAHEIVQGYLSHFKGRTVRIRIRDDKAFLTVKGPNTQLGRDEFEYEVPVDDGRQMLSLCYLPAIYKTRYIVPYEGNRWEVDVFHGQLEGFVLAELEVPSVDHKFALPPFIGREVTGDRRFYNSCLTTTTYEELKPFLD